MFKDDSSNILSTAPVWCHPTPDNMQWRDHWMQSVYFMQTKTSVTKDETFVIKVRCYIVCKIYLLNLYSINFNSRHTSKIMKSHLAE